MSGEALTTHSSLTIDLVLLVLGGYLHNRDAPMREFVDEFRAARAGDFGRFRLGELAARVPEKRRRNAHFFQELARRQPQRREGPVRHIECYCRHFLCLPTIRIPRRLLRKHLCSAKTSSVLTQRFLPTKFVMQPTEDILDSDPAGGC